MLASRIPILSDARQPAAQIAFISANGSASVDPLSAGSRSQPSADHLLLYPIDAWKPALVTNWNLYPIRASSGWKRAIVSSSSLDAFAAELLFPWDSAKAELAICGETSDSAELLMFIERLSQRWGISVEVACDP
jgi:hypothetical protein